MNSFGNGAVFVNRFLRSPFIPGISLTVAKTNLSKGISPPLPPAYTPWINSAAVP